MTKALQLRKIIQDKLYPEGVKLEFGCEVYDKSDIEWARTKTFIVRNQKNGLEYYTEQDSSLLSIRGGLKEYKILGKPTTLQELLMVLGCVQIYELHIPTNNLHNNKLNLWGYKEENDKKYISKFGVEIDLTKSVENQEDKVLDSLIDLIK